MVSNIIQIDIQFSHALHCQNAHAVSMHMAYILKTVGTHEVGL